MGQMTKKNFKHYFIDHNSKTINAFKKINKMRGQSLVVVSKNKFLKGILSFADIRKAVMNHSITNEKINNIYNKKPRFIF